MLRRLALAALMSVLMQLTWRGVGAANLSAALDTFCAEGPRTARCSVCADDAQDRNPCKVCDVQLFT